MSEAKAEWRDGRLYIDGERLPVLFHASAPSQGSRITFDRLTPEESAVIEAAIKWREDDKREFGEPYWEFVDDLRKAVDALLKSREESK